MKVYLRGPERKYHDTIKERDRRGEEQNPELHLNEYTWLDSPADGPWSVADNLRGLPKPFGTSFREVLGPKGFVQAIEGIFEGRSNLTALELGGPGSNLFKAFKSGLFTKTLGVTLGKPSADWVERTGKFCESEVHKIYSGDVFSRGTQDYVRSWSNGGVDLIISRMGAGVNSNPLNPVTPFKALNEYYKMLNSGGVMLLELDTRHDRIIPMWLGLLRARCGNSLTIRTDNSNRVMLLQKHDGAPENLPALDIREIFRQEY